MLVDDEINVCKFISTFLIRSGYECDFFLSSTKALETFNPETYFAALVDVRMPEPDGIEMIKQIKSKHPQAICIMITGFVDLDAALQAFKYGCDDFLLKPLKKLSLLTETIEKCMQRVEKRNAEKCLMNQSLHIFEDLSCLFASEHKEVFNQLSSDLLFLKNCLEKNPEAYERIQLMDHRVQLLLESSNDIQKAFETLKPVLTERKCDYRN
jgi:FixJ family two-component response regulator